MTEVRYSLREIQCDMPGCDSAFEIGLGASWVEVRRSAKSCGWVRVPSGGDLCPNHAKVDSGEHVDLTLDAIARHLANLIPEQDLPEVILTPGMKVVGEPIIAKLREASQ